MIAILTMSLALAQAAAPEAPVAAPPVCERGVYLLAADGNRSAQPLAEKLTDHRRMGNVVGFALLGGLSKMQIRTVLEGPRAELRMTEKAPVFHFCNPPRQEAARAAGGGMAYVGSGGGDITPASYRLVRFDTKPDQREVPVAAIGGFGGGARKTLSEHVLAVDVREIAPGIVEVKPRKPLMPGEYGFFRENRPDDMGVGKSDGPRDRVIDFAVEG